MSDEPTVPDPNESAPFDFDALTPETTDTITDHEPPNANASKDKRKWWKSDKSEKTGKRERKRERTTLTPPRGGLKPALAQIYVGAGMALMPFDPHCARVVLENADKCAESLDEVAKTNPEFRRILIRLVSTSAVGAAVMAHAPILAAMAMHHIPALRNKQEKMVGEFAEMMANMSADTEGEDK